MLTRVAHNAHRLNWTNRKHVPPDWTTEGNGEINGTHRYGQGPEICKTDRNEDEKRICWRRGECNSIGRPQSKYWSMARTNWKDRTNSSKRNLAHMVKSDYELLTRVMNEYEFQISGPKRERKKEEKVDSEVVSCGIWFGKGRDGPGLPHRSALTLQFLPSLFSVSKDTAEYVGAFPHIHPFPPTFSLPFYLIFLTILKKKLRRLNIHYFS